MKRESQRKHLTRWAKKTDNKGFNLVELVVVLAILAILASILTPILIGYIDKAKKLKYISQAESIMKALQSELIMEYGKADSYFSHPDDDNDIDLTNSDFTKKVMELAGIEEEPYVLILYTRRLASGHKDDGGLIEEKSTKNLHDCYTVYSMFYWPKKETTPIYYNFETDSWEEGSLYSADLVKKGRNQIQVGPNKNKYLKVYVMYNKHTSNPKNVKQIRLDVNKMVGYTGTMNKD